MHRALSAFSGLRGRFEPQAASDFTFSQRGVGKRVWAGLLPELLGSDSVPLLVLLSTDGLIRPVGTSYLSSHTVRKPGDRKTRRKTYRRVSRRVGQSSGQCPPESIQLLSLCHLREVLLLECTQMTLHANVTARQRRVPRGRRRPPLRRLRHHHPE